MANSVIVRKIRTLLTIIMVALYFLAPYLIGLAVIGIFKDVLDFAKNGTFIPTTFSQYTGGIFNGHTNETGAEMDKINSALIQIGNASAAIVFITGGLICLVLIVCISFINKRPVKISS